MRLQAHHIDRSESSHTHKASANYGKLKTKPVLRRFLLSSRDIKKREEKSARMFLIKATETVGKKRGTSGEDQGGQRDGWKMEIG